MNPTFREYIPSHLSVYEYFKKSANDYMHMLAISFYGKRILYKELFDKIDEAERALRAWGIGRDDVVALSLPGIPEAVYLIYAINKIGAIYCAFDCRSQDFEILEMLKNFNPKLCIVPDFQLRAFCDVHDWRVVYIDPAHSVGGITKATSFLADVFTGRARMNARHENFIPYDAFIRKASAAQSLPPEKSRDDIFGYFYTSGTTYGRKSIILTNENINAEAFQVLQKKDFGLEPGDSIVNIMPLFTCYGWSVATHLPLVSGIWVNFIPLVNAKKLKRLIQREKPNFMVTVPAHWEYFMNERFDNCDLSFLKTVIVGGDKVSPKYEEAINAIFKQCGSKAFLRIGYGLSETTSTGTIPSADTPKGSVGQPMEFTLVGIFDKDTLEELPPYEHGEICIYGPTVCAGYYRDEAMTERMLKKHTDGRVWLHSGDVGYMDENGYLFFCDRLKRMYVRFDGTKVSPHSIESILLTCPDIADCMVVPVRDPAHTHGMCGKALIVLRKDLSVKEAHNRINSFIHRNLGQHMIPAEVVFVDKLPHTKNGKRDCFANFSPEH